MSNYVETKKEIDRIRNEYGCKGEILFRTAIQYVVECGQQTFKDIEWVEEQLNIIDKKHNAFEREKKVSFVSRDFEKAIIECAAEVARTDTYDLLVYIQKEVWLSNDGGADYKRVVELLKYCMEQIQANEDYSKKETLNVFDSLGFTDNELEEFGYSYLFNEEEE